VTDAASEDLVVEVWDAFPEEENVFLVG